MHIGYLVLHDLQLWVNIYLKSGVGYLDFYKYFLFSLWKYLSGVLNALCMARFCIILRRLGFFRWFNPNYRRINAVL